MTLAILLSACGGGGSGDSSSESTGANEPPDDATTDGAATAAGTDGGTTGGTDGATTGGTTDGATTGGTDGATAGGTTEGTTAGGSDGATTGGTDGSTAGTTDGTTTGGTDGSTTGGASPPLPSSALPLDRTPLLALRGPARVGESELSETLGNITTLMRGRSAIALFDYVHALEEAIRNGTSPLTDLNIVQGLANRVHTCPGGGRQLATVQADTPRLYAVNLTFEGCTIDERAILHGSAILNYRKEREPEESVEVSITSFGGSSGALRLIDPRGLIQILEGSVSQTLETEPDGVSFRSVFPIGTAYGYGLFEPSDLDREEFVVADERGLEVGLVELNGIAFLQSAPADTLRPDELAFLRFAVGSGGREAGEGASSAYVMTTVEGGLASSLVAGGTDEDFAVGQIDIGLTGDSRRLVLQADNGDPASFDVLVFDADDSVISFSLPWDENTRFEMPPRAAALDFDFAVE